MVIFLSFFAKETKQMLCVNVCNPYADKKKIYTVNVLNLSLHSWAFSITADSLAQVHKQRQSQNTTVTSRRHAQSGWRCIGRTSIRTERKNQQRASLCDAAPLAVLGAERHPSSQDGAQRSSIQLPNLRAAAAQPLSIGSIGVQSTGGPVLGDRGLNINTMPSRGFDNGFIALPPLGAETFALSPWHPHSAG